VPTEARKYKYDEQPIFDMELNSRFEQWGMAVSLLLAFLTLALIGSDSLYALIIGNPSMYDTLYVAGLIIISLTILSAMVLLARQTISN
jgi:hypothetical protein